MRGRKGVRNENGGWLKLSILATLTSMMTLSRLNPVVSDRYGMDQVEKMDK